jgi:hypothetical protein
MGHSHTPVDRCPVLAFAFAAPADAPPPPEVKGLWLKAELVGSDAGTAVALLKIPAGRSASVRP